MRKTVLTLCLAEVLTMAGIFAFPALLPRFQQDWGLTNTDAGWISGVYFAGYALVVPVLTAATDRMDARRVYMAGALTAALSCLGFALMAQGFWTAMLFRALGGIGLAGTYMPGLKALVDRTSGASQPRWMSWYTASFSLGTSASFLFAGALSHLWGWRVMFAMAGGLALVAVGVVWRLAPHRVAPLDRPGHLLDFRPVFRNRAALAYILAYSAHMWELFGLRTWIVGFLVFAQAMQGNQAGWPDPITIATLAALCSMAGSIGGADLAVRFDRRRLCLIAALASGAVGLGVGFSAGLSYGVAALAMIVYSTLVQLDSAALTTGAILAAQTDRQGATIAVHSLLGFAAAFLGPLTFGWVLDLGGGHDHGPAWGMAFAALGGVALTGGLALTLLQAGAANRPANPSR